MGFLRCGKRVSYKTGLCRYDSFGPKRVGFGCFPTRFAQVAAAFAVSWACGRCACVRGAWEEGRGGGGVGAMGSCQGVFGCGIGAGGGGAPRPCPGFPRKGNDDGGGGAGAVEGAGSGGCWWGRAAARRTSGYRLSPVRRWRVWEVREAEAPRAAPLPWVPAFARTTVGGAGPLAGSCVGLPHPAPLDSCLRRNDAREVAEAVGDVPRAAPLPWVPAFARTTVSGERERRSRLQAPFPVLGYRTPPLWIPAFAGMTRDGDAPHRAPALGSRFRENDGGRGVRDARGLRVGEGPSTGSGRTETRIAPTVVVGARGVRG